MPGWKDLDKILAQARNQPVTAPQETEQAKIRDGLLKLFEPVADVLQKLRDATIRGYNGHWMPTRQETLLTVHEMHAPEVCIPLAHDTNLIVRVAHKANLGWPNTVLQAKWRLQLVARGHVCEEALVDNRDVMATWIMERVVSYHTTHNQSRHSTPIPLAGTAFAMDLDDEEIGDVEGVGSPPDREASRYYRNISLDDDEGESNAGTHPQTR